MSNTPNVVPSASVLSIVPGSDSSPASDEQEWTLELVIQEMINETPEVEGLTVEEVLHDKDFKDVLSFAQKTLKDRLHVRQEAMRAKEAAAEMEKRRIRKGMAVHLRATALQKAGFNPLSDSDVKRVNELLAEPNQNKPQTSQGSPPDSSESVVPEAVLRVLASMPQLPHILFDRGWKAQSMRCHLVRAAKRVQGECNKLDPSKNKELIELYNERQQDLSTHIGKCQRVISAWGLNWDFKHQHQWATREQNEDMWELLKEEFPKFFNLLSVLPKLESPEEKAKREQAEADQKKVEANKHELRAKLKDRLEKANPDGLPVGFADRFLAKKVKQYGNANQTDEVITSIFAESAVNRLEVAENAKTESEKESGRNTAMFYARAAGMTEEGLIQAHTEFCQQRDAKAAKDSAKATAAKATIGKPTPPPAPPVEESNGGGKGKRRRGGKGKSDGDKKPAKPTRGKRQ